MTGMGGAKHNPFGLSLSKPSPERSEGLTLFG